MIGRSLSHFGSLETFRFGVCAWVFLFVLALQNAPVAVAQHKIDAETWVEMRKMFREKGPTPTIEEDVAALAGASARRAGPRLIDRGPEVLPAVHAALLAPDVEPRHALRLLQVIGPLSEEVSVQVVLDLLRGDPKSPLRRDALNVLATLPATADAAVFILGIASNSSEAWQTRRMAFTWFGLHRDPRGRPYAEALRADPDPERRAAGLYVLARLGDETALEPISEMLAAGAPSNSRDLLMVALAELATPEDFERSVPSSLAWSSGYKDGLRYARYRLATPREQPAVCLEMLYSQIPGHREIAVRCLLKTGHARDLRPFAAVDLEAPGRAALVRNEIRRAGWRIVDTDTEFRIEPEPSKSSRP
jgi:HEAT repeat protein